MDLSSSWYLWTILGCILLALEVVIPGVFMMWWGLAAIVVSLIKLTFALNLATELGIFAVVGIILTLVWWKVQNNLDRSNEQKSNLNRRDKAMIGKVGVVREVLANGAIRGTFADSTWKIRGEDLKVGDRIRVINLEHITLIVEKI